MNSVRDILASGTDSGSDEVRAGHLDPSGELNVETQEWLNNHIANALIELEGAQRDQVFPALLVYRMDAFTGRFRHGYNTLTGDPSQRLASLYITDKIK